MPPGEEDAKSPLSCADRREIEWQLAVPDLEAVRGWISGHRSIGGLLIRPLPRQILLDTYLDSSDWRVLRAGFALRLRRTSAGVEATLKSLRSAREDLADRREITETMAGQEGWLRNARGPVGTRVREIADGSPLTCLFTVHTTRERFAVHSPSQGADIGEIALDASELHSPAQARLGGLQRVEVEAIGAPLPALARLVETLREQCGLARARENKFAAGLRAAGLAPPPVT